MKRKISQISLLFLAPVVGVLIFCNGVLAANSSSTFFVDSYYDLISRTEIKARFFYESNKAYFYIDNNYLDSIDERLKTDIKINIEKLGKALDDEIYPKLTGLFGDVWNPGIDGDPKITVLFTQLAGGVGGYFNPLNELSLDMASNSNVREMVYLNTEFILNNRLKSYLAHEFQHLISYSQKERMGQAVEDVWLNELRSEYAPTYLGYDAENYNESNLKIRVDKFNHYSSDSLTEWQAKIYDYPSVNLLAQYMADHYGEAFFKALMQSQKGGIESFNDALSLMVPNKDFADIFGDWIVVDYLNGSTTDKLYRYLNPLLQSVKANTTASYEVFDGLSIQRLGLIKEWTPLWYEIASATGTDNNVKINFNGEQVRGEFRAKIIKIDSAGEMVISDWAFSDGKTGELTMPHLGKGLKKVVIMPYLVYNGRYQMESLEYNPFTLTIVAKAETEPLIVNILETKEVNVLSSSLNNGDLARAKSDYKVYIINGNYKRHIESAKIFDFYGHLGWAKVKEISLYEMSLYQESNLVRADGDQKVYAIDEEGVKHWLNVSGDDFVRSGRNWGSVYIINAQERDFYKRGSEILS